MTQAWNLIADIGGTNARFAASPESAEAAEFSYTTAVSAHKTFSAALEAFLAEVSRAGAWDAHPRAACIAVAAPIAGPVAKMINAPWKIDSEALAQRLELSRVALLNDFEAIGYALPALTAADWVSLDDEMPTESAPRIVLGAGTGFGLCSVVSGGDQAIVWRGEAVTLICRRGTPKRGASTPTSNRISGTSPLSESCPVRASRTSTVISHRWATGIGTSAAPDRRYGPRRKRPRSPWRTVELFCLILGNVAANAALTLGAFGGVYLAGGIAPRLLPILREGSYRERFLDKGRYRSYLRPIPSRVITHAAPGLLGARCYLQQEGRRHC